MSEGNIEKWVCPSCGHQDNEGNFCIACGFAKPVLTTSAAPAQQEAATPVEPVQGNPASAPAPDYSYTAPVTAPAKAQEEEFGPEDRKKANILCIVSLGLMFVLPVVFSMILLILYQLGFDEDALGAITMVLGTGMTLSEVAALGLMIYVRIKYRKSVFGKVLMWIYISLAILTVITIVVVMVTCVTMLQDCANHGW